MTMFFIVLLIFQYFDHSYKVKTVGQAYFLLLFSFILNRSILIAKCSINTRTCLVLPIEALGFTL